jgi:hypothetical protein
MPLLHYSRYQPELPRLTPLILEVNTPLHRSRIIYPETVMLELPLPLLNDSVARIW